MLRSWCPRDCILPSLQKTPCNSSTQHTHAHISMCPQYSFKFLTHTHTHRCTYNTCNIYLGCTAWQVLSSFLVEVSTCWRANEQHNALNRIRYKGDGLKIRGNGLAMTEAVTITGRLRCLMPNGPLRGRHTGQLPSETHWTLCQFTIILAFVMQHSTNMPLFTDLLIIQLEQNAMTHFWSKSHYQGEEAFSRHCAFLSTEDKSSPPEHDLWLKDEAKIPETYMTIHMIELNSTPGAE